MLQQPPDRISAANRPRTAAAQRLGANVRALREEQRLSKSRLSLMAGISRPYFNAVEKGRANPTLTVLEKLAAALDVTEGELLK